MVDLRGAYFANLSLVESIKLICYLNSNWKLKCHRLDVAIDDYSKELFPVVKMALACQQKLHRGFKSYDLDYFKPTLDGWEGSIAFASRRSEHYVRVYTNHELFYRLEAELKQGKSQKLFDILASLGKDKTDSELPLETILEALINAALGKIDFRSKSSSSSPKNAAKERTNQLPFWKKTKDTIFASIQNIADSNYE